jgi:hypothetical protein
MRKRSGLLLLCALAAAGCAGKGGPGARPFVEAKDSLYVALPAVPPSVDSLLAPLGWAPGRFAAELRKEVRYQLNRKGLSTPEDSAGQAGRLEIRLDRYHAADYAGAARLTTAKGERDIPIRSRKKREERDDPTVDNIRSIAGDLAEAVGADPRRGKPQAEYPTFMMTPL